MSKRIIIYLSLVFTLMATNAYCTTTVDVWVNEVLQNNPELQSYRVQIEIAKASRLQAGVWENPQINSSYGGKKAWSGEADEIEEKGNAVDISLTQTIEWPGRLELKKAIADKDIELAELDLEQFQSFLSIRAKMALYDLFASRQIEAASVEVSDHFSALKKVLDQRSPAGLTPLLEARVIDTLDLNMKRKATEASLRAQTALRDWNVLRGASMDKEFVSIPIALSFRPLQQREDELLALAFVHNYELRRSQFVLKRQDLNVRLAQNEQLPAVSVGPYFSQEEAGDKERVVGGMISLPLPLWNRNQGNIAAQQSRQSQSQIAADLARREAERCLREEISTYRQKQQEISAWTPESIRHFKEAAELADRHYRLGAVPVTVYVELQTQYLEAIQGLLETQREALEAALTLEMLTGGSLNLVEGRE